MSKFFIVLVIFTIVFIECCVGGNDEIEGDQKLKRLEEGTLKPEEHVENGPKNGLKEVIDIPEYNPKMNKKIEQQKKHHPNVNENSVIQTVIDIPDEKYNPQKNLENIKTIKLNSENVKNNEGTSLYTSVMKYLFD
ncbi:hypothetical protein ACQ4LE_009293 [Meloidogyne hapla]